MKIVVLDGVTVSRNDLLWTALEEYGDVVVYDHTADEEAVERCRDAEIVLTNKVVMDAEVIAALPRLKYIGVLATGYNVVDLKAASARGIVVTNIPAYSTQSVAQMVFAHLLNVVNRVDYYAERNREGQWCDCGSFCYLEHNLFELAGKRIGLIGLGNIGMEVARIASAFGMEIVAVTSKRGELPYGIRSVTQEELFAESDVVSLHCPLTESNREFINAELLRTMKPSAILVNTGRGGLVNEKELADALNNDVIAAYCADVLGVEPPQRDNPLLSAHNCYLTPHIAWATREARMRLMDICMENIKAFLAGKPVNVVGKELFF